MKTFIDEAISALKKLPKNSSAEDAIYRLYVLEKIRKSEASLTEFGAVPHAEAKKRMKKWLPK